MTSEARGSRTGTTDFSIARILADDPPPGANVDIARKRGLESPGRDFSRRGTEAGERTQRLRGERDTPGRTRRDALVAVADERRRSGDRDGENATRRTDLTWLQYTRYRPPRLPRRSLAERRVKRRAGDHPRIPFSSSQLQVLEDRYRRGAYLSRNDVVEMSATLRLPQSKIKIWFQNRRARQRRESLNSTIAAR
ncbi:homeobox protein MSX-1 [Temnothorax nylanderi]|uniref:homeobox protein MSX-1 n=1 Tax=Temnothorax nylanderi TaxID=102681 RepID=UPI003A88DACA